MTEHQAVYIEDLKFHCAKCGAELGEFVEISIPCHFGTKKRTWLKTGNMIVNHALGKCINCGNEVEFYETAKTLDKLLERSNRMKEEEK